MAEGKSRNFKVAVVHDWLPLLAGAERVLAQILESYPEADVYTLFDFLTEEERRSLGAGTITASYLNKLPGVKKYYRNLLPFCPMAVEDFDLSHYDLVISSSHLVAKGVITGAHQVHVAYVHSPARYVWDMMHQYLRQSGLQKGIKGFVAKKILSDFRIWDYRTANGIDRFIGNSDHIRRRIWKVYRREADVVYPPVDVDGFSLCKEKEEFYLTASRMVPYKRIDLIAEAFAGMPDKKLVIVGDGPEMDKVRQHADGAPNIELAGYQDTNKLRAYMQKARAFVFAAEEDFGIVPVEAQACGTPVIAYGAGGALETIVDYEQNRGSATGLFFDEQEAGSLREAVMRFERVRENIKPETCRKNAERFAPAIFRASLKALVNEELAKRAARCPHRTVYVKDENKAA